jgi:hypothetical protein
MNIEKCCPKMPPPPLLKAININGTERKDRSVLKILLNIFLWDFFKDNYSLLVPPLKSHIKTWPSGLKGSINIYKSIQRT